jgi:hypothetical protein
MMWLDIQEIKDWLGVTTADFDEALTSLANRLEDRIQRRLQWYFGPPRAKTEFLNGSGRHALFLHQPPVNGVVAVHTRTYRVNEPWELLDPAEYELEGRKLLAIGWGVWPCGERNIRAQYEEGFAEVPGDIQQLLLDLIQANVTTTSGGDKQSEKLGDYSYTIASGNSSPLEGSAHWGDTYHHWKRGLI